MKRTHLLPLLAVPLVTLAACGSDKGSSDKDTLTKIINDGGTNPASVCDHLSDALLKQVGGTVDACKKAAGAEKGDGKPEIQSLKIDGDAATAKIKDSSGSNTITFAKQDGEWKVTTTTG